MLEISNVSWRNFLSYGDYVTTIDLANLGQCLITGEVIDEEDKEAYDGAAGAKIRKSNGAGKSTIPSVIQWVLFGRTMHSANPGDAVINWFTGKDCWGQVTFKNGDSITRTRNTNGHNELIIVKDGDENKSVAETLSTAKNQQAQLSRTFGLDWEIFCGSTFFNQYGKPWMEMADQSRKKALERLLHVDRFSYYAKVAKGKCEKLDTQVERSNARKAGLEREISRLQAEIQRLTESAATFATRREQRRQEALIAAANEEKRRDAIELPNIDKLKAKWEVVKQIQTKISTQKTDAAKIRIEADNLNSAISEHESTASACENKIRLWKEKGGKVCTSCEQPIPHEHVGSRVEPLVKKAEDERAAAQTIKNQQKVLRDKYTEMMTGIKNAETVVTQKQPAMTVRDAQSIHEQWNRHNREVQRLQKLAETIALEENPHDTSMQDAETRIADCKQEITKIEEEIQRQEYLNKHYNYINRAYTDRNKIKSYVFRDHVPFINSRLKHYLEVFGLDIKIELTDSLGIASNMWGYEFESGGERKRTDVAFMLATFDFHEHMFGRQCNILVLDEVDGRLDDDGIDSLINVIKTDLASRVETILVVSHRNMMYDTFPREAKVTRRNRFSHLELV